jgi:hypothetical protein
MVREGYDLLIHFLARKLPISFFFYDPWRLQSPVAVFRSSLSIG